MKIALYLSAILALFIALSPALSDPLKWAFFIYSSGVFIYLRNKGEELLKELKNLWKTIRTIIL